MKNILVPVGSSKNAVCHLQHEVDFAKKWEKNVIYKKDFHSSIPVLVLSGLK